MHIVGIKPAFLFEGMDPISATVPLDKSNAEVGMLVISFKIPMRNGETADIWTKIRDSRLFICSMTFSCLDPYGVTEEYFDNMLHIDSRNS